LQELSFTFDELKTWYNGYYTMDGIALYNPWSVGNALTEKRLGPWWIESGNQYLFSFIFDANLLAGYDRMIQERIGYMLDFDPHFRAQFDTLLVWRSATIEVETEMSYHSFVAFYVSCYIALTIPSVSEMSKSELWTLMYRAGYVARTVDISHISTFTRC
jgi:hypothetical protein